jgi:4-amino-4-deoxy-L-arabinose transferase-like glycosyltransferase
MKKSRASKTGMKPVPALKTTLPPGAPSHPVGTARERESWEGKALTAVLLLGALFRLRDLSKNGYGNAYYASAVRSMMMSWHNFFFVSFDPAGWFTVDKPPVSLWIQTAFAKVFGYHGLTLILPQVLEGLGSVALVHHLVRRRFDAWAALLSALAMALSPVAVAVDRYNNTDACLVFVLLLSAWALDKAVERSNRGWLMASMALAGVAFNTKMMAGFVALPAFYLFYWIGTRLPWPRRFADLVFASIVLAVVALSWPLAVDLTPAAQRPFVGSNPDNSMIGLSMGWNGFQRLLRGRGRGPFGAAVTQTAMNATPGTAPSISSSLATVGAQALSAVAPGPVPPFNGGRGRGGRGGGFGMRSGQPGPLRLADRNMAGQTGWFLPLAVVGLLLAFRRTPPAQTAGGNRPYLLFWAGWFLCYAAVFSFMRGGMHTYYLVCLAPSMAVLAGTAMRTLWLEYQAGRKNLLPLTLLLTVTWHAFIAAQFPDWEGFLVPTVLVGAAVLLACFMNLSAWPQDVQRHLMPVFLSLALVLLFFCPIVWALSPVLGSGNSVEANPDLMLGIQNPFGRGFGGNINTDRLVAFLKANRHGERYLVAGQNSQAVDQIIIKTGEQAIALGGFMGGDPIVTLKQFTQMVEEGKLRYFLLQGGGFNSALAYGNRAVTHGFGGNGGGGPFGRMSGIQADIARWVRDNGTPVEPKLWGGPEPRTPSQTPDPGNMGWGGFRRGTPQLYDLKPKETERSP